MNIVIEQPTIPVFLTPSDAERFKLFMEHYDFFYTLIDKGILDQRAAAVTMHFDKNGTLRTIGRQDYLYDYNTKFDNTNKNAYDRDIT